MTVSAAIFDVDGVLVASPHERAWREALRGYADPDGFTTAFYQEHVAGRPRLDGARSALEHLGVADADRLAPAYAETKQALIDELIEHGEFEAFPDAVRLADALHRSGVKLALASSSKNADAMLNHLSLPDGSPLLSAFDADLCGHDVPRGKPDPAIFRLAAEALGIPPDRCLVVEDAPAGVQAAHAGGMKAVGIARLGDEALLSGAGADLVVTSLDQVDLAALGEGALRARGIQPTTPMEAAMASTDAPNWVLHHDGYSVMSESVVESRFALGNGFLGMRSARSVTRGPTWASWLGYLRWASWPRCYVAGFFDIPNIEPPIPALVPVADWSRVRILLNDKVLIATEDGPIASRRQLDMRRGVLLTSMTHRLPDGLTLTSQELRLLSQANRATGLQLLRFWLDRDDVDVTIEASFSMSGLGMEPLRLDPDVALFRTEVTRKTLAMAGDARLRLGDEDIPPERPLPLRWIWRWRSKAGQVAEFDRFVTVTRRQSHDDPATAAVGALRQVRSTGWRAALERHESAWNRRWATADVVIEGDDRLQRAVRFAAYHLVSAANPEDERVSVGARALTGDAYFGHVFWDTEIYLLPFYTIAWPEAARALLMYRFHTLPAARDKAARMGWKGALYAWESADTGEETTPEHVVGPNGERIEILCGKLEQHVSADIAYAVWQYWRATGDDDFFLDAGAEILLETARFWASRAEPEADGLRHIRHVIGPDEYHEDVDDNAFTNVMARWNIARGLDALKALEAHWPDQAQALCGRLGIDESELADWADAADRIETGFDASTGLYEQFAGFHKLEPIDLNDYADRSVPIDVVIGRERTQASQVVKQADVVALLALLPEAFPGASDVVNFAHYEPRCGHGSSLSPAMHALVAARLGQTDLALHYLDRIARLDPDPNAAGGVRIAGLGAIWQSIVMGFGGADVTGETLAIRPNLPPRWTSLSYQVRYRGRLVAVHVAQRALTVTLLDGEPLDVRIGAATHRLSADAPIEAPSRASERVDA
ncbi:MAG: HAD-IA family hydrolase [Caulobacteraceae bacterium]|nr:HAD-IA family hydrolase [Caulobacteraceae bacterium]